MGIVYVRDNESEIGIPRPPPVLGGKTLPSSGPSPISSSPQTQPCSAPAPFSFHSPTSLFPEPRAACQLSSFELVAPCLSASPETQPLLQVKSDIHHVSTSRESLCFPC